MNSNSTISSTQLWNGDPRYYTADIYTTSIGTTTTAYGVNPIVDDHDDTVRRPLRASREVGAGLAEMINGDLEK